MGKKSAPPLDRKTVQSLLAHFGIEVKTMSDIEQAMERLAEALSQQGADELLEQKPEDDSPKPCPKCGRLVRVRKKGVPRTVEALSGEHTIVRNHHYCERCHEGFYPRDAELGLPAEGSVTLELERRLADFAVNDSYEACARRWQVHYRRAFSATMFRRVAQRLGERLVQSDVDIAQRCALSTPRHRASRLYVMTDGGMVPMQGGLWREAKLGVLFRADDHVKGHGARRGFIERARYVGVLGEQEAFKEALRAALDVEGWHRAHEVVWLGDGALGNWTLADMLAPKATQILDIQHAIEHGVNCGKALLGEDSGLLPLWHARIEQLLYAGDIDVLVRELMDCWLETDGAFASKAIGALVGYYRHNEKRMRYAEYRARGLMIGSGVIESAHRHVVQSRMKKAGQHWSEEYGGQMVGLRAIYSTVGPKRFHESINRALCLTHVRRVKASQRTAA